MYTENKYLKNLISLAHEKEKVPDHTSRKDLADEESATVDAVDDQKTLIRRYIFLQ